MLQQDEIRQALTRYTLSGTQETRPDGSPVFLAWYEEVPGCMVEADSREAALAELDAFIVPFIESVIADGGRIPRPMSERVQRIVNNIITINQVVLGDMKDLLAAKKLSTSETAYKVPVKMATA